MKITVHVKTNAYKNDVVKVDEHHYLVSTTASPIEGKANEKVVELLSDYFRKPKSEIWILRGETTKTKLVVVGK